MWRSALIMFIALILSNAVGAADAGKTDGALYPAELLKQARENVERFPWAAEMRKQLVAAAEPWMKLSDDELWGLMFGNTIKRSWMVWSNGYCPSCKEGVPMYNWVHAPLEYPWKVRCPHCEELFPKNDFHKFYLSGLDEHGVFDPKRAERSLLFNAEHPDPSDPLHEFGVDDGEGYVDGDKRWRFIGAYLIYGQWKKAIVAGITNLAAAYAITGDRRYSHKAGVLLDRVADLYPTFDFGKEGVMYEGAPLTGYVSTWHDACWEARELAFAYDQVFVGLQNDPELVAFLAEKAKTHRLDNPKSTMGDIRRNIEERIFRDTLTNSRKIHSNYPQTDLTIAIIKTVLGWPGNREEVMTCLGGIVDKATAVDGLTGEKGLTGYSSLSPISVGATLGLYSRVDAGFLRDMVKQHPRIHDCYRFHIDTWCFGQYYPFSGDCGAFARRAEAYQGLAFSKSPGFSPSMFTFLWQLYEITNDPAFVQVLYRANGKELYGLPHDLFAGDVAAFRSGVKSVVKRHGPDPTVGSVNKQEWHLAILRSPDGRGAQIPTQQKRALWLDYDTGGNHGHQDGMNLGLFAKGLDLMPDFGYPPVHYGGWGSPRSKWYTLTAAHNTVVVDGANQQNSAGQTTLWADGRSFRCIRASAPGLYANCAQYERTASLVDISDTDSYVIDVFRVTGGNEHAKLQHSHFGSITTRGLALTDFSLGRDSTVLGQDLKSCPNADLQMRGFRIDTSPSPGWSVDWKIEDRYKYAPPDADIHLRYTDLTTVAEALTCEKWISLGNYNSYEDAWIPCVVTRRRADSEPLASTFVSVIEPYEQRSAIRRIRRLPLTTASGNPCPDSCVAVEITLIDGRRDLFITSDAKEAVVESESGARLDGEMCLVRRSPDGAVSTTALCNAKSIDIGGTAVRLKDVVEFVEVDVKDGRVKVVAGPGDAVVEVE